RGRAAAQPVPRPRCRAGGWRLEQGRAWESSQQQDETTRATGAEGEETSQPGEQAHARAPCLAAGARRGGGPSGREFPITRADSQERRCQIVFVSGWAFCGVTRKR